MSTHACPHCKRTIDIAVSVSGPVPTTGSGKPDRQPTPRSTAAGNFRMPFGRHKGKSIAEIYADDPEYLAWFAANVEPGKARDAVRAYLEPPANCPAPPPAEVHDDSDDGDDIPF